MVEKNEIASVWHIEDNNLKNSNKIITKTKYKEMEIAILKSERNSVYSGLLIKDKDNIYWQLRIAPIKFEKFINVDVGDNKQYCEDIYNALSKLDLKEFFRKMIEEKNYFNKCQLKYVSKYCPELYENALKCRNDYIENLQRKREQDRQEWEIKSKEQVRETNEILESKISDMKERIHLREDVEVEEFEFYKDDNYHNGKTCQNNILYLANYYGIEIPLATKGFINNRLVKYNFGTGYFSYKIINNNKKASTKIHEYMDKIIDKVEEEYKKDKEIEKIKNRGVLE